jgi:hypothetical protein
MQRTPKGIVVIVLGRFGFIASALFIFSACTPKSSPGTSNDSATFVVGHVAAAFSGTETHPNFNIPTAKTLSLTACINDNQYSKSVKNHSFVIQGGDSEVTQTTDADGCLNWQEKITYNHLADAAYLAMDRTLVAKGYQKGSRVISLGINPWSEEAYYLKEKGVPNLLPAEKMKEHLLGSGAEKAVWADAAKVTLLPLTMKKATGYRFDVKIEPKIMLKNAKGDVYPYSLTQGTFNVRISLIRTSQSTGQERHDLIAQSPLKKASMSLDGNLAVTTDIQVKDCSLCSYEVGLDVTPENGPPGLVPLHGIYPIGSGESLPGTKFAQMKNGDDFRADKITRFSVEKYTGTPFTEKGLNTVDMPFQSINSEFENGVLNAPVIVNEIRTEDLGFENISPTVKRHRYWLSVCLVTSVNRAPVVGHPVSVTGLSGVTPPQTPTQGSGCARIQDYVDVNSMEPVCWQKGQIHVVNELIGINETVPVKVSAMKDGAPNFIDLRSSSGTDDNNDAACQAQKSYITSGELALEKVKFEYSFDANMNLILTKRMRVMSSLHLNRPSAFSNTMAEDERLPVGKYRIQWVVVDITQTDLKNTPGDKIYGGGVQDINVNSLSQIQEEMSITLDNLKSLGSTNTLLLEVRPMDKNIKNPKGLESTIFNIPITLSHQQYEGIVTPMRNSEGLIPTLLQRYAQARRNSFVQTAKLGEPEVFARNNGLTLINLKKGQSLGPVSNSDLQQVLNPNGAGQLTKEMAKKFCLLWRDHVLQYPIKLSNGQTVTPIMQSGWKDDFVGQIMHRGGRDAKDYFEVELCERKIAQDPRQFFDLEYHYIAKDAHPVPNEELSGSQRSMSVNEAFSLSRSYSDSRSASLSGTVGASVGAGLPDDSPLHGGVTAGASYSISHNQSQTASSSNSVSISNNVSLDIDTLNMSIAYSKYEKCLVIRMNPAIVMKKQVHSAGDSLGTWMPGKGEGTEDLVGAFDPRIDGMDLLKIAHRGYMVCAGEISHQAMKFKESFYVISQHTQDGNLINSEADIFRPLFMDLRGRGSFITFLSYINAGQGIPAGFNSDLQTSHLRNSAIPAFWHTDGFAPRHIISTQ